MHSFLLYSIAQLTHSYVVRPLIVSMIRWPLNYSQLSWHISLSDLHCHGILYSNSPTTTIIFTVISKLFSTVMAHLVVWPPLPWNILLSFSYPPMFVHLHKFLFFNPTAMAHFLFLDLHCHGIFYRNSPIHATLTSTLSRLPWHMTIFPRSPSVFSIMYASYSHQIFFNFWSPEIYTLVFF